MYYQDEAFIAWLIYFMEFYNPITYELIDPVFCKRIRN